jgi:hypothetical protein
VGWCIDQDGQQGVTRHVPVIGHDPGQLDEGLTADQREIVVLADRQDIDRADQQVESLVVLLPSWTWISCPACRSPAVKLDSGVAGSPARARCPRAGAAVTLNRSCSGKLSTSLASSRAAGWPWHRLRPARGGGIGGGVVIAGQRGNAHASSLGGIFVDSVDEADSAKSPTLTSSDSSVEDSRDQKSGETGSSSNVAASTDAHAAGPQAR